MANLEKKYLDVSTQPTLETWMFDSLERDFQEVLIELEGDRSFDRFREEYEKLHRALRKSHESEKRLVKKCRELNGEIQKNEKKVTNSLKLNEEDAKTIRVLKSEIDKAWKMVDASQEKEAKAKENIQALKKELVDLDVVIDQGATITIEQDAEMEHKDPPKLSREIKKKERIEKDLKIVKANLVSKENELQTQAIHYDASQDQILHLNKAINEAKIVAEKASKELQLMNMRMEKLNIDMEVQISTNTQLMAENSQRQVELKIKDEEIESQIQEIVQTNKLQEAALLRIKSIEFARDELKKEHEFLFEQKSKVEKDLEDQKKLVDHQKKQVEEIAREKDTLSKLKTQGDLEIKKQFDAVKVGLVALKNLEVEISLYKRANMKQDADIKSLEKQSMKYSIEATKTLSRLNHAQDVVRTQDMQIMDFQKKLEESNVILRQQLNINEAIRSEKNLYSKNLVTAQDEIKEMKRKFKMMSHLVEQLKEELSSKDVALIKEHFDLLKVEKEREILKAELSKASVKLKTAEETVSEHLNQIEDLNRIISEDHDAMLKIKKELEICKCDRDLLGIQIVKKNHEIKLIYEKMNIQTMTLIKGQVQYNDRLQETRILKIKIIDLKRNHSILTQNAKNINILKKEIFNLSKELSLEKTKEKALSEELENPLNVHRWRKLEGSDPQAFEMILKIQTLQKRLILKTEEAIEKDMLIQEKEKLHNEMCNVLARQPGPEIFDQVVSYARSLNRKSQQMKAMASELNMLQVQIAEYKLEIGHANEEIDALKGNMYISKKKGGNCNMKY